MAVHDLAGGGKHQKNYRAQGKGRLWERGREGAKRYFNKLGQQDGRVGESVCHRSLEVVL